MKIQPIIPQNQQQNNRKQNNTNFTGFYETGISVLRWLDTNQAWGANTVDLCSMVIPRTTVDFVNRGPEAGTETARRESMGTINHASIGLYGTAAGLAFASMLNNKYGIKAHKIFANDGTIDILSKYWSEARQTSNDPQEYVKNFTDNVFDNIKLFNTDVDKETGLVKLSENAKKEVSQTLVNKLINSSEKTIGKETLEYLQSIIVADIGAESKVVLEGFSQQADNSLKTLLANFYNVSKTFMSEKVDDLFKSSGAVSENPFIKDLKSLNLKRSIAGLGIAAAIGMSTQPVNMYLTKKKTGSDGFVGVPGREKDNTGKFKMMKLAAASAFSALAISTITTKPIELLNKLQFKGVIPTVSQLKLVYGLTIASRLLAARDKDELRESLVKDTLGFLNLLVLGALVTKGIAHACDKSLINVTREGSKNFFGWLTNSSLKTRDEVLLSALKKQGVETVRDGKAIPFKELLKHADKATKGKLRVLNIAQLAGYIYSGVVLGIGVPKLNIYMTNKSEAKRKAKLAEAEKSGTVQDASQNLMFKPQNLEFLSKNM